MPSESPFPRIDARWVYPGSTGISLTPIAPGDYRLIVEGVAERTVSIRDGEITRITLP